MKDQLIQVVTFIGELEKLKTVSRQNRTLDGGRQENSAEHSWHVALMAVLLEEYLGEGIDILRVVKMLLIHDVVEIDVGDTYLYDEPARESAQAREALAAERLFSLLPEDRKNEFMALWQEFEERETADALAANVVDNLQPLLNHNITRSAGQNPNNMMRSAVMRKKAFIEAVSPDLWEVALDAIDRGTASRLYHDA